MHALIVNEKRREKEIRKFFRWFLIEKKKELINKFLWIFFFFLVYLWMLDFNVKILFFRAQKSRAINWERREARTTNIKNTSKKWKIILYAIIIDSPKKEKKHKTKNNFSFRKIGFMEKQNIILFYLRTKSQERWIYWSDWVVWWLILNRHTEIWIILNYVVCKTTVKFVVWSMQHNTIFNYILHTEQQ